MRVYYQDTLFAVARLDPRAAIPGWASDFFAVTRTADELSIVCPQDAVPADATAERDFRILMVEGPLDFALTGVLASIATPLAEAGISIFAISTYETDYVMVRAAQFTAAVEALQSAGWDVAVGDSQ
jgi:hypothetical protein